MEKLCVISLLLLFSNSALSETFNLVCDTPLHRNTYQFDTESKVVTKIGYYSYDEDEYFESPDKTLYSTIEWDTEGDSVVWVTYDFTKPDYGDVLYTNMRHGTILTIIFDLHYKNMTYTLLTRVRGRVTHYRSSRRRCYPE
jgi:hypothetical protein